MSFPYLFTSVEECDELTRGTLGELFSKWMEEYGFECLGFQYDGSRNIANNVRPINTLADCKGLKIRSMDNDIYIKLFKYMGCNPTPMGFSEIYTAAQQGVIDGNDNPAGTFYESKFQEVHKYYSMTKHTYGQSTIVGNKEKLAELPDDIYQVIKDGAQKYLVDWQREASIAAEEDYLKKINDAGCTVNEIPDENLTAFRDAMQPLYKELKGQIGDEAWVEIEKAVGRKLV